MPGLFEIAVPTFQNFLTAAERLLDKAAAASLDERTILDARLAPDMHPFPRQVQIACDMAKSACARLAGRDVPAWPDDEASLADLKARVRRTLDYVAGFTPADFEGSEERTIELTASNMPLTFDGTTYLVQFTLPNFYFHLTTAYALLRREGLEIGKRDFFGRG